jgi:hypothetical protein
VRNKYYEFEGTKNNNNFITKNHLGIREKEIQNVYDSVRL